MTTNIAERELLYSVRGSAERNKLLLRIFAPFKIVEGTVNFQFDDGTAGCVWQIDGLPEQVTETAYGADSVQALQLAINFDGVLRSLRSKYDFYFPSGEQYFED